MSLQSNARPWTEKEIEYLRANYATMRTKLIALHLDRNSNSVIGKADRLGLASEKQEPDSIKPRAMLKLESALGRRGGLARARSMENQTNPRRAYHPLHDNLRLLTILTRVTGA